MSQSPDSLAKRQKAKGRRQKPSRRAAACENIAAVRFVSLLLSAVWIGGLAVLGGVAAPAVFAVLQMHDPVAGRTLAGEVFGAVLWRYQHVLWITGGLQLALLGARAALGPRPRRFKVQLIVLLAMLAAASYSALAIAPRIDAIRTSTSSTMSALPDDNPVKREFGRLHGLSNGLLLLAFAGALSMFWFDSRE